MNVGMIGPRLDAQGGISTVARTWLNSPEMSDVKVDYVGTVSSANRPRKAAHVLTAQARFLGRLARGWRPDVFHIHASYFVSFYRKMAYFEQANATGRPVLLHLHAPDLGSFHDASPVHARAMSRVFHRAARVVVLSDHMKQTLEQWWEGLRIEVLYNPVDLKHFDCPARDRTDRPTVLFMGAIGERKGTWDLVSVIPRVLKVVPGARFRFGGDGEVDRLRSEIDRLGVSESVEVLGWVRGDGIPAAFAAADLYCLPSYNEGLPMSILEAMAARLPVVSCPIAGIPEAVLEGETGTLVTPGDRDALAGALIDLLSDGEKRGRMGAAGRSRAETHFDVDHLVSDLKTLWRTVADERAQA